MQFVHAAPASVVAPDAPYRPAPHTPTITHDACAGAGWYCPGKHASQEPSPLSEKYPAGQLVQVAPAAVVLSAGPYSPDAQAAPSQVTDPGKGAYWPGAQDMHFV